MPRAPGTTSIAIGQPDLDECAAPPKDDLWGAGGAGPPGAPMAGKGVLRAGSLSVNGRLPPEVVARVVRQNQSHVTACYQNGLRSNPRRPPMAAAISRIRRSCSASSGQ